MHKHRVVLLGLWLIGLAVAGGGNGGTGFARGQQYGKSVPLESLTPVDTTASVFTIGPDHPASYHGTPITRGIQIAGCGINAPLQNCPPHSRFQLGMNYTELDGTVYGDDKNTSGGDFLIYDTTHSTNPDQAPILYKFTANTNDATGTFKISVRGVNFLTFQVNGAVLLDLVANLLTGQPAPTQVVPRYPTGNAGVPADSKVLFGWQPFPKGANYAFHIWLVGLAGSATLTPTTPFSFAASIYHKTSYIWNDHGFLPGTYEYSLLPLDDAGHNLAGWSTPIQIVIASS